MRYFVDTSGWIPLFASGDKYHKQVALAFPQLQKQVATLVTSDYVFDETVTYLQGRYGKAVALSFGRWALNTPSVDFLRVDKEAWSAAWQMFQGYTDKEWSLTDCTSFILMQQNHIWTAFAFDNHFTQAGFQLWPG